MVTGVIYKYTSPDGGIYIGQTINECQRRGLFFLAKHYGGVKIDAARRKFGPENFQYEVLIKNQYPNKSTAKESLNKLEAYYINKFDSVNSGYNTQIGNDLSMIYVPQKQKEYKNCADPPIKRQIFYTCKRDQFTPVDQYALDGKFIATYESISTASRCTGAPSSNISKCCHKKITRVRNFIFRFKGDKL